jgi:hypothetical protein
MASDPPRSDARRWIPTRFRLFRTSPEAPEALLNLDIPQKTPQKTTCLDTGGRPRGRPAKKPRVDTDARFSGRGSPSAEGGGSSGATNCGLSAPSTTWRFGSTLRKGFFTGAPVFVSQQRVLGTLEVPSPPAVHERLVAIDGCSGAVKL